MSHIPTTIRNSTRRVSILPDIHKILQTLITTLDEEAYKEQFHHKISPIGWHIYHTLFIENFFLHETVIGDKHFSDPLKGCCLPENIAKSDRGSILPPPTKLLTMLTQQHRTNLALLHSPSPEMKQHPLMQNNYLLLFLIQHHAMHLETIYIALTERNLNRDSSDFKPNTPLLPSKPVLTPVPFPAGNYTVGNNSASGFDNEKPAHTQHLELFTLNHTAVSNAEFLKFMCDGGYENSTFWDTQGQRWLQQNPVHSPHHWQQSKYGHWFGINHHGPHTLQANAPVYGINYYEAAAFAKWAHARLPHEHEIEIALQTKNKLVPPTVWEWCHNTFYPYPGFSSFPYKRYSETWFDQQHKTLKGGSYCTAPILRRPSFRNFYTAEKRHILSGLRLAFDGAHGS